MKRLTKVQTDERSKLCEDIRDAYVGLTDIVAEFNEGVDKLYVDCVAPKLAAYNAAVVAANEWQESLAETMQGYADERSEKWQEGDAGQAYEAWKAAYEEAFDEIEIDAPEPIDVPEDAAADELEGRPDAPEG